MIDNDKEIKNGEVIKCPICNKVLFIKDKEVKGQIAIRCLRCKKISKIELK